MRRLLTAVVAAAVAVGGAAVADTAMREPERLPAPPEGETVAAALSDGAPVFVSRDADGVSVVSPVSTRLLHIVWWCAEEELFVEPVGATMFDRQGRWVNGPAGKGLARYEASLSDDGDTVTVGDLGEPLPRAERSDYLQHGAGECVGSEGELGGTAPELPEELGGLDELSGHVGERVVVRARLHASEDGMRLCAYGREDCGAEQVTLASTWWPGYLDGAEGWQDGRYLVLVQGPGRVSELATVRRPAELEEILRSDLRFPERPETVWADGRLLAVDADAGTVTLAGLEAQQGQDEALLPDADADGTVTLPLSDDPQLVIDRELQFAHFYPDEFQQAIEAAGRDVPVEAAISEDGQVGSLIVWE